MVANLAAQLPAPRPTSKTTPALLATPALTTPLLHSVATALFTPDPTGPWPLPLRIGCEGLARADDTCTEGACTWDGAADGPASARVAATIVRW